ncbi:GDSL esterase/lipase [Sesamum alatum]|uniref:GDSL esterase/lipase n=1 Tax=Sesamum alatum TaxID=300844 RepID=A0AAE1XPW2_9LAMI|nr:GDSL esterase/lipase [Sesamum alatum]
MSQLLQIQQNRLVSGVGDSLALIEPFELFSLNTVRLFCLIPCQELTVLSMCCHSWSNSLYYQLTYRRFCAQTHKNACFSTRTFAIKPVSVSWMLLLLMLVSWAHAKCALEAIFSFRNSNSDAGGFYADFPSQPPPNGMTDFKRPTG